MNAPGQNIMNAVAVLRATTAEVHAMLGELERLLTATAGNLPIIFLPNGGKPFWTDSATDEHRTVTDAWRWTFQAQHRRTGPGRRRPAGEFSVLVDIGQGGGAAAHLGTPCVLAAWTAADDSWIETIDNREHWPPTANKYELVADRLFVWKEAADGRRRAPVRPLSMAESAWYFLVPLTGLTSPESLTRAVVRPTFDLIGGVDPAQALAGVPEIVRLSRDADGDLRTMKETSEGAGADADAARLPSTPPDVSRGT